MVTPVERCSHNSTSVEGYSPAACSGNLGNKTVGVKTAKGPADLRALLFGILTAASQMKCRLELGSDVAIGEASQARLPASLPWPL